MIDFFLDVLAILLAALLIAVGSGVFWYMVYGQGCF